MKHRAGIAGAMLGASLCLAAPAYGEEETEAAKPTPAQRAVVEIRRDLILLLDIAQVDKRITAVGERLYAVS
jgi:hypothetical protein